MTSPSNRKSLLIISYSELHRDPRVLRQISLCSNLGGCEIITMGYTQANYASVDYYPLTRPKKSTKLLRKIRSMTCYLTRNYMRLLWVSERKKDYAQIAHKKFDLIIMNDVESVPIVWHIWKKSNCHVIFDLHEYYLDYQQTKKTLSLVQKDKITQLIKRSKEFTSQYFTVSPGLVDLYGSIGINAKLMPNACSYSVLTPSKRNDNQIHLVHHGVAAPGRQLEKNIDVMQYLDERFILNLYLLRTSGFSHYYDELMQRASQYGNRVRFHAPVDTDKIPETLNKYDIGLYILVPSTLNQKFALPNKLFEFIQARLAIAIGNSTDMKTIVGKYNLGIMAEDFEPKTLARELNGLNKDQILYFKENAHSAANLLSNEVLSDDFKNDIKQYLN